MTAATNRAYGDEDDLRRMLDLVGRAAAAVGPVGNMHLGDVLWRRFMLDDALVRPERNVRLWEVDGELVGFAWCSPPRTVETQFKPGYERALLDPMLDWAETRRAEDADPGSDPPDLVIDAAGDDLGRIRRLETRGFRRDDGAYFLLTTQPLDREIAPSSLPPGASVRAVVADEVEPRVAIHCEVWHPSRVTVAAYRRLRTAPGYCPDLDLVAVAPDGAFAAYAICWYDPISRSGEFEPVGTRPAYRGQGYGRAVMTEGLRRLQALGARTAIVYSYGTEEPANRLYASCGFRPIARIDLYRKPARWPDTSALGA